MASQDFAVSIRDLDFKPLYVNDACLKLFGETREEWNKDNWEQRYQPEQINKLYDEVIPAVITGKKWRGDFKIITPDGTRKRVLSNWDAVYNNKKNIVCYYGIYSEVTRMSELKENLRKKNKFLNNIIDALPEPLVIKSSDGNIIAANKAYCCTIGKTRKDLKGKNDFDIFPDDVAKRLKEHDNKALHLDKSIIQEESIIKSNGEKVLFSTKRVSTNNDDGEKILICIARDITSERTLQKTVAESYHQLETYLTGLSYDLLRIQDDVAASVSKASAVQGLFENSNTTFNELINESQLKNKQPINPFITPTHLSPREYQVFLLLIQGKRIKEVANELDITGNTASTYRSRIMKKLNISSITELIQYAMRQGLI
ncbi:helix-turn-helix transcriptional regulator [Maridesulfovibrio salexigens]|uniref:helix-turn-helix transcriptional regulator n=1 Tax=Maridesulfovibrio salexigens TaxID=880 RepID=UPI0018D31746|nr:PAS domain S-box protein [Maridesulfovibrio salexigens]